MRRTVALAGAVALAFAAGCATSTVRGRGAVRPSLSRHHDFPSTSNAVPPTPTAPTVPSEPTFAPSTNPVPITRTARIQALLAQTNGEAHTVVAVPGGYEAATYDQYGDIQFWRDSVQTTTWQQIGRSRYPYSAAIGPPHARVIGARLSGMDRATFIVRGYFSGDGSGNAVAFTGGPNGWGTIKAEPNGNIGPSGSPVGSNRIGLAYNFAFSGGDLITQDCPTDRPIAQCGRSAITKRWVWNGTDFILAR